MITVAGIDQSRNGFGWAIGNDELNSVPKWGVDRLGDARTSEGVMYELAAKRVRFLVENGAQKVFFEKPKKIPTDTMAGDLITIGIPAIIMHTCYLLKVPAAWVEVDDWRERFLGTKKAPPGLVNREARTKWFKETAVSTCLQRNWLVEDHNAAEALGIMDYGLCCMSRDHNRRTGAMYRRKQGRTVLL